MTKILVKTFVKNYENVDNPKVRQSYGEFAGIVGIICNIFLFIFKFVAGLITGAVSVSADAFNNLSDAGSSIITLLGFKMAGKPADPDHPYGHGRIEYIAGFIVSALIISVGFELFTTSIEKIFEPEPIEFSVLTIVILVASIFLKMWMALFNRTLGKKVDSTAMMATSTDSLTDCIATTVVLISVIICSVSGINIDGYAGVLVACFVMYAGIGSVKETLAPLLGQPPKKEFVEQIKKIVMEDKHIIGIHDLIVHDYGPGRVFASMHAEIPSNMNILEAHDIIDIAEMKVKKYMGCGISIHMDPVVMDDAVINELKDMTLEIIRNIDSEITMHDFRTTKGPYITNLIFDVVVPFDFKYSDDELKKKISAAIKEKSPKYNAVIVVDKMYAES